MYPGKPCHYCTSEGCGIYESRPQDPCVEFQCGWLKEENKVPQNLKPSECGAILMLDRDWHGRKNIRAVPAGESIPEATIEQLKELALELKLPLIFAERLVENGKFIGQKSMGFGPPSFIQAVKTEVLPQDVMRFDKPDK